MDKKDFLKRLEAHRKEMFELGHSAYNIAENIVIGHGGKFSYKELYGETQKPCWIYLDNNLTVNEFFTDESETICVMVQDEWQEVWKKELRDFNPQELMDIAEYLCNL